MNNRQPPTERKLYAIILIGIVVSIMSLLVSLLSLFVSLHSEGILSNLYKTNHAPSKTTLAVSRPTVTSTASNFRNMHIIGGFSAHTPDEIVNASDNGIKDIFYYGNSPTKNSTAGLMLQALNMKMIDGFIASNLHYYECQRGRAMIFPPSGLNTYCRQSSYPTFSSEADFLATIATHLKQVRNNDLIVGYWVLDDWAPWDPGGARQFLIKVHQLIQQYTPDRPAICGFGAGLIPHISSGWDERASWKDSIADNFITQGCDEVGLYIYTPSLSTTVSLPPPETYDWSMSKLLPMIFASLEQRGWNIAKEPLIGIAQGFGGPLPYKNIQQTAPTAEDIETQSKSFCQHGATGLTFYAWNDTGFGPTTQTPLNTAAIESGIRSGIAICKQYWNSA